VSSVQAFQTGNIDKRCLWLFIVALQEFLKVHTTPISSDVFTAWGALERAINDAEAVAGTVYRVHCCLLKVALSTGA
jgi:hypothetical protein